ncbi:MAG: thioredoxin [Candidatus Moranbacteria bacterium]|nr:thioredoxin [Candidatus Moranbacteria bacterium]
MSKELEVNDSNFESEIKNHKGAALVDFWAPWCGPCQMMSPIIEELADKYKDKIKIKKLNIDENPNTAQNFQVMSIPTLIFYKDGEETERIVGAHDKETMIDKIEENL